MADQINVDSRINIRVVPDGEVHIVFNWSLNDLAAFAQAFVAMSDGKIKEGECSGVFRLRNKEGIDYLIRKLQRARRELYGEG